MKRFTRMFTGGTILVLCMTVANVINLTFNAYLGRVVAFEEFGVLTFLNTLWYLISLTVGAVGATIAHRISYISSSVGSGKADTFFLQTRKKLITIAGLVTGVFIASTPALGWLFHISPLTLVSFAPIVFVGAVADAHRNYLQGRLLFVLVGVGFIVEALSKFIIMLGMVHMGWYSLVYISLPLSVTMAAGVLYYFAQKHISHTAEPYTARFPVPFTIAAFLAGLSAYAFLTFDVLLVKHYFSPILAGQYALLSMIGKMIFFVGSLLSSFIIVLVSRDLGKHRNPNATFYILFGGICFLVACAYIGFAVGGVYILPIIFGSKVLVIVPYLELYGAAIALFTVSNAIVTFHLARKHYIFPAFAIFYAIAMVMSILFFHQSIMQVVYIMVWISSLNLASMLVLHNVKRNGGPVIRNLLDMLGVVMPIQHPDPASATGKRILVFNWRDPRHAYAGGAEVYIHELAKRWVLKGHSVTIFCGNDQKCPRNEIIDGVEIIRRGGFYFVYVWAFFYYIFQLRGKYDLIIDSENGIPFFTPLYASEPVVLLIHHVHQEVFRKSLKPPFSWIAQFLEGSFMPYVYRKTKMITVSPSSAQDIVNYGISPEEPEIVYNGVDLSEMQPGEKSEDPLVVFVGRLKFYKSIHVVIHAMKAVVQQIPNVHLVIAGAGEEDHKLKKIVADLNLEQNIRFAGKVSQKKKIALFKKAWVCVNPSFMEGWGITTIEANACGTPVLASDVPGLRDSVKHNESGMLLQYGNVAEWSSAIIDVLTHSAKRKKLEKGAIAWAQSFDWDVSAEKALAVFEGLYKDGGVVYGGNFALVNSVKDAESSSA